MKRRKFIKDAAVAGGATAVAASTFPAPAIAQSRIEIAMVATWGRDFPGLGTGAQRFAKRLSDMTDGRMNVTYFAANERVKAFDSFDEVNFGGGQELWDELAGSFGLKCMPCGNTGVQMGGWFRKEINSPDDLKGLKMRIPGLGGDVMAKLGASPVSLPGGQIYENLISGAIDATEWVGPWNDSFYKFYEAAKYYYYPGMHEPASMLALGMNKSWWEGLSNSDQLLIKAAAHTENDVMMSEYNAKNGSSLDKLIREQGVKLKRFNDDVYDAFGEASEEVFDEARQHSNLANRIHESFAKARKDVGRWMNISDQEYLRQRNRVLGVS